MKLPVSLFLLSLLLLSACNPIKVETVTDAQGNTETFEYNPRTKMREGWYKKTAPDGKLLLKANYRNNRLEGVYELYNTDGKLMQRATYKDSLLNGPFRENHFGTEAIASEGMFKDNMQTGEWKIYYPSGKLKELVTFVNGDEDGPYKRYYENGTLEQEGQYKIGFNEELGFDNRDTDRYEHGENKYYSEDGQLEKIMMCNYGICKTTWKKEE